MVMDYLKYLAESDAPIHQGKSSEESPLEYLEALEQIGKPRLYASPVIEESTGSTVESYMYKGDERPLGRSIKQKHLPDISSSRYLDALKCEKPLHLVKETRVINPDRVHEYLQSFKAEESEESDNSKNLPTENVQIEIVGLKQQVEGLNKRIGSLGGGGTNAYQYYNGGVMYGDLTVVGTISAGSYANASFDLTLGTAASANIIDINTDIATNSNIPSAASVVEYVDIEFDDVAFYDDFSRYTNGMAISAMLTTPLVGEIYRQGIGGPLSGAMFIEEGALRCPLSSNNYLGFSVDTPDGEFDMYFDIEVRRPPGSSETTGGGGFTLSTKESQIVPDNGIGLGVSGAIHSNITLNLAPVISHFQQVTPINKISSNVDNYLPAPPSAGVRTIVRVYAKGDIYEVTVFGKTNRYQSTAFPGRIGNPKTYAYFQLNNVDFAGLPNPAVRCYTVLHRMWANGKRLKLNQTPTRHSAFDGNVFAVYPNRVDIQPLSGFYNNLSNRNETLRVGGVTTVGNTFVGGGIYVEGAIRQSIFPGLVPGNTATDFPQSFTAVKQSSLNAALSTTFHDISTARPTNPPLGSRTDFHIAGFLGPNTNIKRFQIREAGGVIFDSLDIPQNGGVWEIKIYRHCLTGISEAFIIDFWTETTGRKMQYVPINRVASFTSLSLNVQGTALGDVTMTTTRSTYIPHYQP